MNRLTIVIVAGTAIGIGALIIAGSPSTPEQLAQIQAASAQRLADARAASDKAAGREAHAVATSPAATEPEQPARKTQAEDAKCKSEDWQCVLAWFPDHQKRLLNEFRRVREMESQIASAMRSHNDYAVASIQDQWIRGHLYQHQSVIKADGLAATRAGIFDTYDVLLSDCRVAIIELKYLVLVEDDAKFEADRAEYLKSARACENKFGLGHPSSELRVARR
jgi:hypothetical protein